jgi:tetratricopeptide (TPR) repeat protein
VGSLEDDQSLPEEAESVHELNLHLDDFTLLRYTAGDLDLAEQAETGKHLEACPSCLNVLQKMRQLDAELMAIATDPSRFDQGEGDDFQFSPEDPFQRRPQSARPRDEAFGFSERHLDAAVAASSLGVEGQARLLAALSDSRRLTAELGSLDFSEAGDRFSLLYALQSAGHRIAESPTRALRFSQASLSVLRAKNRSVASASHEEAERQVPRLLLAGQAHMLAGQACIWTGDFEKAQTHLRLAYRSFAQGGGDETSLALVEHIESQRRSFVGKGREALVLAKRATATFEAMGLEDLAARAKVSQGLAFFDLDQQEDAVKTYRETLPVFEKCNLWSNYVGALNSIGTSLVKLGRLSEARQEYAKALRRLSRDEHRSWLGFIRHGLADVLFAAGRYREAAISLTQAARLYAECGLPARSLTASLFEIESWARSGDLERAHHRLELFRAEVARQQSLDPSVLRQVENALAGLDPEFHNIADLRKQTERIFQEQLQGMPA